MIICIIITMVSIIMIMIMIITIGIIISMIVIVIGVCISSISIVITVLSRGAERIIISIINVLAEAEWRSPLRQKLLEQRREHEAASIYMCIHNTYIYIYIHTVYT